MDISKLEMPLDIVTIQKLIPHRYPFLLIDKVIALNPGQSISAIKSVSISDPVFQGHFPGKPTYPGVLMVEGIAQAAGVLGVCSIPNEVETVLLGTIEDARFRRIVDPGTTLRYDVAITKSRGGFYWFKGHAYVGDEVAVTVTFSAVMKMKSQPV